VDADLFENFQKQLVKAWDDKDYKLCSFKYIVFDDLSEEGPDGMMHPPAPELLHRKRQEALNGADTGLWEQADAHNPDPRRFCPVQLTGFNALHERRVHQNQVAVQISQLLQRTRQQLKQLEEEQRVTFQLRMRHYKARQQQLAHRVVRLAAAFERQHLLRSHGGGEPPLDEKEAAWVRKLQQLAADVRDPAAGFDRLYGVAVQLQSEESADPPVEQLARRLDLQSLEAWLLKQQEAISKLVDLHKRDIDDCKVVLEEAHGQTRGFT